MEPHLWRETDNRSSRQFDRSLGDKVAVGGFFTRIIPSMPTEPAAQEYPMPHRSEKHRSESFESAFALRH